MYLRQVNPELRVYVVEPWGADSLATCCCCDAGHGIQGGGYGKEDLAQMRGVSVDGYFKVTDEEAAEGARILAREEGIFAGYSTGAQVQAAIGLLRGEERGKVVGLLACDSGMKYFSTGLWG